MPSPEDYQPPRPLHVLQLTSTSKMGGAEQMVMHLVRHADPARLQPEILSLMGPGHLALLGMQAGVKAHNWALNHLANPRLLRRMQLFLREGFFDLVHTYGLRADLLTRWVAHGQGLPLISSISSPDPWRKRHHVMLDRLTADGVTAWIAVCEAARQTRIERERFPADRIHVVYNGIPDQAPPDEAARKRARMRLKLSEDAPVLAVVANLRPAKGYPDLIGALALLKAHKPGLVCLCAGHDDSEGAIPRLAEQHGVGEIVRWLGFVNDPVTVLAAADVFVLPSHWEGCPVSLLEAMRAALPSVATSVGGIPEMIEHERHGLLVPARDVAALADAIASLLDDASRRSSFGVAARARFLEKFTVSKMIGELTTLYERYARRGH